MKRLAKLIIKLLSALSLVVEITADLYHAIRLGLSVLFTAVKAHIKQSKNK